MPCCEFPSCPCYRRQERASQIQNAPGQTPTEAAYPAELSPELARPYLTEGEPAPSVESVNIMADNGTFFSPYPGTFSQGNDGDDAHKAVLVSHSAASVERNQDSQFAAAGQQRLLSEVAYNRESALEAKFDAERGDRQQERESARQFAELKAELAVLRAEAGAREVVALRAELAEARSAARSDSTAAMLAQILSKIG